MTKKNTEKHKNTQNTKTQQTFKSLINMSKTESLQEACLVPDATSS